MQYNYSTTAIREFFLVLQLYCTCADSCCISCNTTLLSTQLISLSFQALNSPDGADVPLRIYSLTHSLTTLQHKFSTTCRKLAGYLQQDDSFGRNYLLVKIHLNDQKINIPLTFRLPPEVFIRRVKYQFFFRFLVQ